MRIITLGILPEWRRTGLDAAWSSGEPNQLIGHLAWLVIAEIAYTRAK